MKKLLNKKIDTGITLIALVITIVVLIILATVVINLTLGNNGILNRARTATEQYQNAQSQEEIDIAKVTNEIDGYVDGNRGTITISEEEYNRLLNSSNSNNYSTTEQIVGKWIDGKPLYQKTINCGAISSGAKDDERVYTVGTDLEYSTIVNKYLIRADGYSYDLPRIVPTATSYTQNAFIMKLTNGTTVISYFSGSNGTAVSNLIVTIQYTKTTDTATNN